MTSRIRTSLPMAAAVVLAASAVGCGQIGADSEKRVEHRTGPAFAVPVNAPGPRIKMPERPKGIAIGNELVWVTSLAENTVTRIDPTTNAVKGDPIPVGASPHSIVVGGGSVWVANFDDDTVIRIDESSGRVVGKPISVCDRPLGLDYGLGAVWVACLRSGTVLRISASDGQVQSPLTSTGTLPYGLALGPIDAYVTDIRAGALVQISVGRRPAVVGRSSVGNRPSAVAADAQGAWVVNTLDDSLVFVAKVGQHRTARAIKASKPLTVGDRPVALALDIDQSGRSQAVYVANLDSDTVVRVDPNTMRIVGKPLYAGDGPTAVALGFGSLWVTSLRDDTVARIKK